jgi:hypothetical protein
LPTTVRQLGEGADLKAETFNFAPTLAKPFFLLLKIQKTAKEKWFLRIKMHKCSILHKTRPFAKLLVVGSFYFSKL